MTTDDSTHDSILEPINLYNPLQFEELKRQRQICGWEYNDTDLHYLRNKQDEGLKPFFWILSHHPPPTNSPLPSNSDHSPRPIRAGHISLDSYANPPDPELATAARTILTIQTFFILPQFRSTGLGRTCMDALESMATKLPYGSPGCKRVTLTALSRRISEEEGDQWKDVWKRLGRTRPLLTNQSWYERRGYVAWKEEERYSAWTTEGEEVRFIFCFMRKELSK